MRHKSPGWKDESVNTAPKAWNHTENYIIISDTAT